METSFIDARIEDFTKVLASKAPVPGGGGASALAAGLGISLAAMVGNLTAGKPKYAEHEEEVQQLLAQLEALRARALELVDEDALSFAPLAAAYGIPKADPQRPAIMEKALADACVVPLQIMELAAQGIMINRRMAQIGSRLAVSDAAAGAAICKSAMEAASLNVFINCKSMTDREAAAALDAKARACLDNYGPLAQQVFDDVLAQLRG